MLSDFGVRGKSLNWFSSFLSDRKFCVKVGSSYSITADISSGVIESSVLGLSLYTIFINPLLKSEHLPVEAFADDLKFIANTTNTIKSTFRQKLTLLQIFPVFIRHFYLLINVLSCIVDVSAFPIPILSMEFLIKAWSFLLI